MATSLRASIVTALLRAHYTERRREFPWLLNLLLRVYNLIILKTYINIRPGRHMVDNLVPLTSQPFRIRSGRGRWTSTSISISTVTGLGWVIGIVLSLLSVIDVTEVIALGEIK